MQGGGRERVFDRQVEQRSELARVAPEAYGRVVDPPPRYLSVRGLSDVNSPACTAYPPVSASMTSFRSRSATFGSWAVIRAPRLSFLDGIASKENPRFGDVLVLSMFCASQD